MKQTLISYDPFERLNIVRLTVYKPHQTCDWCGSRPGRFHYGTWADDENLPEWDRKAFCSIGCYRAYHCK